MELSKDEALLPYTMVRQHTAQLTELSASLMALVGALSETVPGFLESYARRKKDSDTALSSAGATAQLALIDGLIQRIQAR